MKERKIFCIDNIAQVGLDHFRPGYTVTKDPDEAAGILIRSTDIKNMTFSPELRAIARAGAGVNNIPIEKCSENGIVVFNTPGANANSVKELVLAALFLSSRDIIGGNRWINDFSEDEEIAKKAEKAKKAFAGREIAGKTLGVIGLGAIGVLVANAAIALGMKVYGYDPYLSVKSAWSLSPQVENAKDIESVCAVSDYITIHVPATKDTSGMINENLISKMKDGVVLLNFSRDTLVDEKYLEKALSDGKVSKYVTDFANPLSVKLKNAIVLPHLGASTEEAEDNCAIMAVKELQNYLDNGNIINSVNFPSLDAGICATESRVAILHRNIPNMLSQITAFFGQNGLNIEKLANNSRENLAYTIIDISNKMPHDTNEKLKAIDGVLKVRKISEK